MSTNDRLLRLAGLDAVVLHLDSPYSPNPSTFLPVPRTLASLVDQPLKLPFQLNYFPLNAKQISDVRSAKDTTSLESLDWISCPASNVCHTDLHRCSTATSSSSSSSSSASPQLSPKLRSIQGRSVTPSFFPASPLATNTLPSDPDHFSERPPSSYHDEPALYHPNSPYIPWRASIRSQIFHPMTSSSTLPTSPHSCSPLRRVGARAPESCGSSEEGDTATHATRLPSKHALARASRTLRSLGGMLKRNFGGMTWRMGKYIRSKPEVIMARSSPVIVGDFQRESSSPRTSSVMSLSPASDFDDLAAWLEACNRHAAEDCSGGMSLDEYETNGSWLDLRPCPACYPPSISIDDDTIDALLSEFSIVNTSCTTLDS